MSRWRPDAAVLGCTLGEGALTATSVEGAFDYSPPPAASDVWWMNFANSHLFCAYGMAAFAQDEIQVAEHPILGSVLEALSARRIEGLSPLTREGEGVPTPIVIRGVERWCAIDTDPELATPYGIYGRRLDRAPEAVLRQAVTRCEGGPLSNIIAMEAPQGVGPYTVAQVREILVTATTGFAAAVVESSDAAPCSRVIVHTGHWGTGAYGGDRVLMVIVQMLAARAAGLGELVYHSLDDAGLAAFAEGARIAEQLAAEPTTTLEEAAGAITARGFVWGSSDGN